MAAKKKKVLSGSQRVTRNSDKKKDAGLMRANIWVHPDEVENVRKYAAKQPKTKAINTVL